MNILKKSEKFEKYSQFNFFNFHVINFDHSFSPPRYSSFPIYILCLSQKKTKPTLNNDNHKVTTTTTTIHTLRKYGNPFESRTTEHEAGSGV